MIVLIAILGVAVTLQARKNNKVAFDNKINDFNECRISTEQGQQGACIKIAYQKVRMIM